MPNLITSAKPNAILVDVIPLEMSKQEAYKRLEELAMLVATYGGIVVVKIIQKRGLPDYGTFIGKGKVDEIIEIGRETKAKIVILNNIAKPMQIFNLNEAFRKAKVEMEMWDRIDLILNIFDKHAQSTEAKLQIELARIRHMGPRIMKMGAELMQQAGGIGQRGGAGETNIEIMKRHLRKQEDRIMEKLRHYDKISESHRKMRKRHNFKTAALVGYTNAGKSSLLNALTNKGAYVADVLFATLETKVGKLYIPAEFKKPRAKKSKELESPEVPYHYQPGTEILISDTIGFIQDLPPTLIKAFKSTLGEAIDADILLHVIDVSDPMMDMKIDVVEDILNQLGIGNKPKIYVFNKIDLIDFKKRSKKIPIIKPLGIIKAGKGAVAKLGWHIKELEMEKSIQDKARLKKRYKEFSPVFISADKKENLQELINILKKKI